MSRCIVIAEAGVNHNGSLETALRLVDVAAEAGADIVKFQTFKAERLVTAAAPKAQYQRLTTAHDEPQFAMLRRLELSEDMHLALRRRCDDRNIEFLSTPFDIQSLGFLAQTVGVRRIKIPSGEITNGPLLLAAARTGLPIILSTGMSTLSEVETALKVVAFGLLESASMPDDSALVAAFASADGCRLLRERVSLLHCTTEYPAAYEDTNLRAMDALGDAFALPIGLSDHTADIFVPIAAVGRGAVIIEKHFTLDRTAEGPDHAASLQPAEFSAMVNGIRAVEAALGSGVKQPAASELKNISIARKSLVAARPIAAGEQFTAENLTAKRPATGRSPMDYWRLLGTPAWRDFARDEAIT
ncbi:MAG: N-acetylneuraminate synthase [Xanthobacteraceae bacterium]